VAVRIARGLSLLAATGGAFFVSFVALSAAYFALQVFVIESSDPKLGPPVDVFALLMYLSLISAVIGTAGFAFSTLPFSSWRALSLGPRLWLAGAGAFVACLIHVTGVSAHFIYPSRPRMVLPIANVPQHLLPGLLAGFLVVLLAYARSQVRKAAAT
jgi:hypothetical protein